MNMLSAVALFEIHQKLRMNLSAAGGGGLQEAPLRKSNLFDVDPACAGSGGKETAEPHEERAVHSEASLPKKHFHITADRRNQNPKAN